MMLEGGAFNSPEFREFSKNVVPFLHVTTHIEGRTDDDLLARKAKRVVFPTILILDAEGEVLVTLDRARLSSVLGTGVDPVPSWRKQLAACERYVALRAKAAAGDASVKVGLAVAALTIGKLSFEQFDAEVAGAALTAEQKQAIGQVRANAICEEISARMRSRGQDPATDRAATETFAKLFAAGTHPDSDSSYMYWWVIAKHGLATHDRAMLERSLEALRATGGPGRWGGIIDEMEAELAKLRSATN